MSRQTLFVVLLTAGGSGCIRSPAPVDPGALTGRVTSQSPPVFSPPGRASVRAPEGQPSPPDPVVSAPGDRCAGAVRLAGGLPVKEAPPAGDREVRPAAFDS